MDNTPDHLFIPMALPRVGDTIYTIGDDKLESWVLGKIIGMRNEIVGDKTEVKKISVFLTSPLSPSPAALTFQKQMFSSVFQVTFSVKIPAKRDNRKKKIRGRQTYAKASNLESLAYSEPCFFILEVGLRVIARWFGEDYSGTSLTLYNGEYYSGVVGEESTQANNRRYLIFFDDGLAQYARPEDVLLISQSSKDVWLDIPSQQRDFIKNYLENYVTRTMIDSDVGDKVFVSWNDCWYDSRIIEVDSSMVKVQYDSDHCVEWLYRGSPYIDQIQESQSPPPERLRIMSGEGKTDQFPPQNPLEIAGNRENLEETHQVYNKGNKQPSIRGAELSPIIHAARHSFKRQTRLEKTTRKTAGILGSARRALALVPSEYMGNLVKVAVPLNHRALKPFMQHNHDLTAVQQPPNLSGQTRKSLNPFVLPMWYGWRRQIGRHPKKHIYYSAPCGKRLHDYEELQTFLTTTQHNIGIDLFCFELKLNVRSKFVPVLKPKLQIKGLSYGEEQVPISCVNSLDLEGPHILRYSRQRIPSHSVSVQLSPEFLTCCNCTDDCLDKEKCACWQLTIQGTTLTGGELSPEAGYKHRRLCAPVPTGIYECNQKCKCRLTCSNRVVQNPLKWQLQVFKTRTKGWGVRSLFAIPAGSFICCYSGELLSGNAADQNGQRFGDEYLAELDYIEVIEEHKEDYEEIVVCSR